MNVLVACEESQAVSTAFRSIGHNAFSCDILDCSGGHPEYHIKQDVIPLLDGNCSFHTCNGDLHTIHGNWDLIIAHPPCTYLSRAGERWFDVNRYGSNAMLRNKNRNSAISFFMHFVDCKCDHVAIENPVGVLSSVFRKPDQIIHPYQFCASVDDEDYQLKQTCLWLRGLPLLKITNSFPKPVYEKYYSQANRCYKSKSWVLSNKSASVRSKTFQSIACAMAAQWTDIKDFVDWDSRQIKFF